MKETSAKSEYKNFLDSERGFELYNQFKDILYGTEDSLVEVLLKKYLRGLSVTSDVANFLDIGGGDGRRILHILQEIKREEGTTLTFVEPSKAGVAIFRKRLEAVNREFVEVDIQNCTLEEADIKRKYDFIFLVHSIYTFEASIIDKLLPLKKEGGYIIVVANGQESFLGKMKQLLDQKYKQKRFEINDIKRAFDERGVPYKEFRFFTEWNISAEDFVDDMSLILTWLSMNKFQSFSPNQQRKLLEQAKNLAEPGEKIFHFKEEEVVLSL